MKNVNKFMILGTAAAMALSTTPAAAQNAEETINVGLDVTIEEPNTDAVISGLDDVSLNWTEEAGTITGVDTEQTFCLFTPTQFFSLTATGAATGFLGNDFVVTDAAQTNPDLDQLTYRISIRDSFSGTNASLGNFANGIAVTGIDSDLFNTDPTCTDGENVTLQVEVRGNYAVNGIFPPVSSNNDVLEQIADGLTHSYTDQLTLLIEPTI